MTVVEIKNAIDKLSLEERAELMRQLHVWENDEWDEQMNRDAEAGKFDGIIQKIKDDSKAGHLMEGP
jgi:hypothetical protein